MTAATRPAHTIPTPRELEVLTAAAQGHSTTAEIAQLLGISEHSVRDHWRHIYIRYGVHSRTQAVMQAIKLGDVTLHRLEGGS